MASVALFFLLTPQLAGIAQKSRESSDWRNLDGAGAVVNSLGSGMTLAFLYGIGGVSDPLHLNGHRISCFDGSGTISVAVKWPLPNLTLAPGLNYRLTLVQGEVRVTQGV